MTAKTKNKWSKVTKKRLYIVLGLMVLVVVIGVFLIPVPNNATLPKQENAVQTFADNQAFDYSPTKITVGNFNLPTASMKLYQYSVNDNQIINIIRGNISNLSIEKPEGSVITTMANTNYKISFDTYRKILNFFNTENVSSQFDGYSETNALSKFAKVFGINADQYSKYSSSTNPDGTINVGYSFKLDGVNVEFTNDRRTNIDITIKNGKLTGLQWIITNVDSGSSVKLISSEDLKKNFNSYSKVYYSNRIVTSATGSNPAGALLDTSTFNGTIQIDGGTLVYFSQNENSNYIVPTYKLKAKYTDTNNKVTDGFVYVPAYQPS